MNQKKNFTIEQASLSENVLIRDILIASNGRVQKPVALVPAKMRIRPVLNVVDHVGDLPLRDLECAAAEEHAAGDLRQQVFQQHQMRRVIKIRLPRRAEQLRLEVIP